MKNSTSTTYALLLVIGDFLAILGAFVIAYVIRVSLSTAPFVAITARDYVELFLVLSPVWILVFAFLGLYSRDTYEWRWREYSRLFVGALIGTMAIITYEFATTEPIFPARIIPVYGLLIAFLLLVVERSILRQIRLVLRRYGWGIINTMIIGNGSQAKELVKLLKSEVNTGYRVVSIVSELEFRKFKGLHFRSIDTALAELPKIDVHMIVLTELSADSAQNARVLAAAQENHCAFRYIPSQEGMISNSMEVELFQGMPIVAVHQTALTGWGKLAKRVADIIFSGLALVILSPFFLFIAMLIKFSDGGRAIFKQPRLTRFEGTINIYKFRTMKLEYCGITPEEAFEKMGKPELSAKYRKNGDHLKNDPRVTKVGRFLRSSSLDELPQLVNIFKGDISLVGPRALVPVELEGYAYKSLLLSVKSGLTGLAQISGRKDIPFEERRKLDLYYVQNWSFWLDMKIIYRTFIEVLSRNGAK